MGAEECEATAMSMSGVPVNFGGRDRKGHLAAPQRGEGAASEERGKGASPGLGRPASFTTAGFPQGGQKVRSRPARALQL